MFDWARVKIWRPIYWKWRKFLVHCPQIYYLYKTLLIRTIGNRCIDVYPLSLDGNRTYDILFQNSKDWFTSIIHPFCNEKKWLLGRLFNGLFDCIDAELYYSIIRNFRPDLIIEIGCGHSTSFAYDAVKRNGKGNILCIDPVPRRSLPSSVRHVRAKIEEVNPNLVSQLGKNDILFIDSSHTKEETSYHLEQLLPRLKPGVIIHHHDVVYPYEGFPTNGEEPLLLNFYMEHQSSYKIVAGTAWLRYYHLDSARELLPCAQLYKNIPGRTPMSLWAIKQK